MATNIKNVTELDFDQIKTNLKVFLSSQEKFNDYDFDGAGLNVLLDILAYNTQYNALLAHMNTNESFLDSAQIRANVVSHAKSMGYVPTSNTAARAYVDVTVTGNATSPATLQIPKGTTFSGQQGANQLSFVTNNSFEADKDINNQYKFTNVELLEGKLTTVSYRVDNAIELQKFKIPDPNIDVSTMIVRVRESLTSSEYQTYTKYTNINEATSESRIYFVQENSDGQYEFHFGDGNLGVLPSTGRVVDLTYLSTNGADGNGTSSFTINGAIGGFTSIAVANSSGFTRTATGTNKESIDSIRYNAPKLFAAQNRAVTSSDYRAILLSNYEFIQDISVWGGEVNDPPVYGKVFISIKPKDADFLSTSTKAAIVSFLNTKNVGSITTDILDPDYTLITIDTLFKYDPNLTSRTKTQLESAVRETISNYNDTYLEKFDGVLRSSQLLAAIDNTDQGILNSVIRLKMHKHVEPIVGTPTSYDLQFSSAIYESDSDEEVISTNTFIINGIECKGGDLPIPGDFPNREVVIRSASTNEILYRDAGIIYPRSGRIVMNELTVESSNTILVFCSPDSNDIAPKFNQLVKIELDETPGVEVTGEEDLIATLGSTAAAEYKTFPRHGNGI